MKKYNFTELDNWDNYLNSYKETEFDDYLKETGKKLEYKDVNERFEHYEDSDKCLADALEYVGRSIVPRPWQKFLGDELMKLVSKSNKCLDYGCGAGNIGVYLAENGYSCDFLDIHGEITDFVEWRLKQRKLNGQVLYHDKLDEYKDSYDLVFMVNVLEHLKDPIKTIHWIHEHLNKRGYFYYQWSTEEHGLDLLTHERYNEEIEPLIQSLFKQVDNDKRLWVK